MLAKRLLAASLAMIAGVALAVFPQKVQAAGLPFSVQPVRSTQQRKVSADQGYFDVVVAPGKTAELQVVLQNRTNQKTQVRVNFGGAITGANGSVDYAGKSGRMPKQLAGPAKVTIPANKSVIYTAKLTMPEQRLDGMLAGSLVFAPVEAKKTQDAGVTVRNKYRYLITVLARNTDRTWTPELQLRHPVIEQTNYHNQIGILVVNPTGTFANQLHIDAVATHQQSGKKWRRSASNMQVAPHSQFNYAISLPKNAAAGTYEVNAKAYYEKQANGRYVDQNGQHYAHRVQIKAQVKLSAAKAKQMQKRIATTKRGLPWFIVAGAIALALMAIVIVILIIMLVRKRKREKE